MDGPQGKWYKNQMERQNKFEPIVQPDHFFILGSSPSETNEYSGFSSAESAGNRSHRHQYSDMLNQVYTSHLHAQLNHPGSNQVQSHNSSKGSSQMFGNNNQSGQTAFGKSNFLYTSKVWIL